MRSPLKINTNSKDATKTECIIILHTNISMQCGTTTGTSQVNVPEVKCDPLHGEGWSCQNKTSQCHHYHAHLIRQWWVADEGIQPLHRRSARHSGNMDSARAIPSQDFVHIPPYKLPFIVKSSQVLVDGQCQSADCVITHLGIHGRNECCKPHWSSDLQCAISNPRSICYGVWEMPQLSLVRPLYMSKQTPSFKTKKCTHMHRVARERAKRRRAWW